MSARQLGFSGFWVFRGLVLDVKGFWMDLGLR